MHRTLSFVTALLACTACTQTEPASPPPSFCAPEVLCGSSCTDVRTDVKNCGGCGVACGAGMLCIAGNCTCPAALSQCSLICTDLATDSENCGACGIDCYPFACVAAQCECPSAKCDGICVDTSVNPFHCGGCNMPCPPSYPCQNGTCTCPTTECSGTCVDTQSDPLHCGGCDIVCPAAPGELPACVDGSCRVVQTLVTALNHPSSIAIDATHVYFTTRGTFGPVPPDGAVQRIPTSGGSAVVLAAPQDDANHVAVNATHVIWSAGSAIHSTPLAGGAITSWPSLTTPGGVATNSTHIYWTDSAGTNPIVQAQPLAGGTSLYLDSPNHDGPPGPIAVGATHLYWLAGLSINAPPGSATSLLRRAALDGTMAITLEDFILGEPRAVAVDEPSATVFWTDGYLKATPAAGGTAVELVQENTVALAVRDAYVYFINTIGEIKRVPKAGGAHATLVRSPGLPIAIAVDSTAVYWLTEGTTTNGVCNKDGALMKLNL